MKFVLRAVNRDAIGKLLMASGPPLASFDDEADMAREVWARWPNRDVMLSGSAYFVYRAQHTNVDPIAVVLGPKDWIPNAALWRKS